MVLLPDVKVYCGLHSVYRRSEAALPARVEEVHHAKEEGIIFDLIQNPKEILADENGWINGIRLLKWNLASRMNPAAEDR